METFVVRAWRAGTTTAGSMEDDGTLRGVVEHVGTGTSMPFGDAEQLIAFLRSPPDGGSTGE